MGRFGAFESEIKGQVGKKEKKNSNKGSETKGLRVYMGNNKELSLPLRWAEQRGTTNWGWKGVLFSDWRPKTLDWILQLALQTARVSGPTRYHQNCAGGRLTSWQQKRWMGVGKTAGSDTR